MINEEGFKSLYVGLAPTYLKVIPSTAICFTLNEKLKILFGISKNNWLFVYMKIFIMLLYEYKIFQYQTRFININNIKVKPICNF